MIITKSPLRISFTGGGTDIEHFYKLHDGHVVSIAINKYVYTCVNKKFDDDLRICYSKTENVSNISSIKHQLIKTVLNHFSIRKGLEIVSIADVPGNGSGLGSSSSFTCSLVQSINYFLKKKILSKENLSKLSYNLEKGEDSLSAGKQDHYASVYGGLNYLIFKRNGGVKVNKIILNKPFKQKLENSLFLVYTGISHNTKKNLTEQVKFINNSKVKNLIKLTELSKVLAEDFKNNNLENLGDILNESWSIKKKISNKITNFKIDQMYKDIIIQGAAGGKLLGSGGGGFLLFYAKNNKKFDILKRLKNKKIINFEIDLNGTNVLYRT